MIHCIFLRIFYIFILFKCKPQSERRRAEISILPFFFIIHWYCVMISILCKRADMWAGVDQNSRACLSAINPKEEPEMLKLPGVGKIFKRMVGWPSRKRKSHKKKTLLNLRKDFFFLGNYGWPTYQLQIITDIYMIVNSVPGQSEWTKKIKFYCIHNVQEVLEATSRNLREMLLWDWDKIKHFGGSPHLPTWGHGATSRFPFD